MNSTDIKLLKNYLSSFFIEFYSIPSYEIVLQEVNKYLSDAVFPAFGIAGLLDILQKIIECEMNLKVLSRHYTLGAILLDHPNLDIYEDDKCLTFFKIVLNEEMVPMPQALDVLRDHCIHIVQYDECHEARVNETLDLFKKVQNYCSNAQCIFPLKEIDAKHCNCYEYEMSGDCHHVDDDESC